MTVARQARGLTAWFRAGSRQWWLIGGGVVALLLLGTGGWYWWDAYQATGTLAFSHASALIQETLSAQARPEQVEAAVRALEGFIARYPRHPAVPQAAYHLGNLRYQTKTYEAARDAYRTALSKGAVDSLAALCRVAIGYTWEAQGNHANALDAYQEAAAHRGAKDFLYEESLLAVARTQELLQRREQALETYRALLREFPQTPRAEEIRSYMASVEGALRQ